jgi:hypothetical protein
MKKPYSTPTLIEYGSLGDMTAGARRGGRHRDNGAKHHGKT